MQHAYHATHYGVEAGSRLDIRIGEYSPAADALLDAHNARRALLLSARNPFSEEGSEAANQLILTSYVIFRRKTAARTLGTT